MKVDGGVGVICVRSIPASVEGRGSRLCEGGWRGGRGGHLCEDGWRVSSV